MADSNRILSAARRLVVKVGSSLLVDDGGRLDTDWMAGLAADLAARRAAGADVVLISSGAIAAGRRLLGLAGGPRNRALRLEESQAAAAAGQIRLAHAWQEAFAGHGLTVAQILLTLDDTESRRRFLNARSTIETLLAMGVVPVVNENDTVATDEIRFGDNDRLAARVAQMIAADACVLLTDIDGLYSVDPAVDAEAEHIGEISALTDEILAMAGAPRSSDGSGGMVTKLEAARIAMGAGCRLAIANGHVDHPLAALCNGARCSWFLPDAGPKTARKQWIAAGLSPAGSLTVDDGAAKALRAGRSLLPAGVTGTTGNFERGDVVTVLAADGSELGRGLTAYSSRDAARIIGHKSDEIEGLLGYRGREEMIHRDDLVMRS